MWNYGKGLCTLNSPKTQGATGHLNAAGQIKLDTLTIDCGNDYATILAISLDDQELSVSSDVLIQVGTTARPYGWKTFATGKNGRRIDRVGSSPWNLERTNATIHLKNSRLKTAAVLDANGVAIEKVELRLAGDSVSLKLPTDALYVVLRSN